MSWINSTRRAIRSLREELHALRGSQTRTNRRARLTEAAETGLVSGRAMSSSAHFFSQEDHALVVIETRNLPYIAGQFNARRLAFDDSGGLINDPANGEVLDVWDITGGCFPGAICMARLCGWYTAAGFTRERWVVYAGECLGFNARITGPPTMGSDPDSDGLSYEGTAIQRWAYPFEKSLQDRPAWCQGLSGMAYDNAAAGYYPKSLERVAMMTWASVFIRATYQRGSVLSFYFVHGVDAQSREGCEEE